MLPDLQFKLILNANLHDFSLIIIRKKNFFSFSEMRKKKKIYVSIKLNSCRKFSYYCGKITKGNFFAL